VSPVDGSGRSAPLCGFLLRSTLLRRYPGLEIALVPAEGGQRKPEILRMETIGDGILLALVLGDDLEGVLFKVPREGLAYHAEKGELAPRVTDLKADDFGARKAEPIVKIATRDRAREGVIDVLKVAEALEKGMSAKPSGARFAFHWLSGPDDVMVEWMPAGKTSLMVRS
jgi:hypothetical protein